MCGEVEVVVYSCMLDENMKKTELPDDITEYPASELKLDNCNEEILIIASEEDAGLSTD